MKDFLVLNSMIYIVNSSFRNFELNGKNIHRNPNPAALLGERTCDVNTLGRFREAYCGVCSKVLTQRLHASPHFTPDELPVRG